LANPPRLELGGADRKEGGCRSWGRRGPDGVKRGSLSAQSNKDATAMTYKSTSPKKNIPRKTSPKPNTLKQTMHTSFCRRKGPKNFDR